LQAVGQGRLREGQGISVRRRGKNLQWFCCHSRGEQTRKREQL
jgi:hypothetical protein